MSLPANGLLDTEVELNFALQVSSCIGFVWLARCSCSEDYWAVAS